MTTSNATLTRSQIEAQIASSLPMITKSLYRYVGDNAEDVAGDAIIKALTNIDKYNGKAAVSTWVYQIARNTALDYIRKHKPVYTGDAVFLENKGGSYVMEEEDDFSPLHVAIASLSAKHQQVLKLHYFEGLKYKEIAEVIGKPIGTVMSRLNQAKAKLKASSAFLRKFSLFG